MHVSQRATSSQCFHHSSRPLAEGETLPSLPSLTQQLVAFHVQLAREQAAAAEQEASNESWDDACEGTGEPEEDEEEL